MQKGKFIVIEGIDGAGKTTLAKTVAYYLTRKFPKQKVIQTSEPRNTEFGHQIFEFIKSNPQLTSQTVACLMNAARVEHLKEIILPALKSGAHVVCDRYFYSTLAYQGLDNALMCKNACNHVFPDLTFWLDIFPKDAHIRLKARQNEGEEIQTLEELTRVAKNYGIIFGSVKSEKQKAWPNVRLNANKSAEDVECAAIDALNRYFQMLKAKEELGI